MANEKRIVFDPFWLDLTNECLWEGAHEIKLRPKAFAVLEYLLGRPGQLITKEELLNAVWPGTFVGEAVLKVTIRQLREALTDDSKTPRFIETAHRRGYRFIGQGFSQLTNGNFEDCFADEGSRPDGIEKLVFCDQLARTP